MKKNENASKKRKLLDLKKINKIMKYGCFFHLLRRFLRFKKAKETCVKQCKRKTKFIKKVKKTKINKKERKKKLYGVIKNNTGEIKKREIINKRFDKAPKNNEKVKKENNITELNIQNDEKTKKHKILVKSKKKKKKDKIHIQNKLENINHNKKGKVKKKIFKKHKIKDDINRKNKTEKSQFKQSNEIKLKETTKNDDKYNTSPVEIFSDLSNEIFRIQYTANTLGNYSTPNYIKKNIIIEKPDKEQNLTSLHHNKNNIKELHEKSSKKIEKFDCKNKSIDNNITKEMFEYFISKCIELKNYIVTYNSNFKNIFNYLFNEYMFLKKYMNSNHNTYHKLIFFFRCKHYLKKLNYLLSIFYDIIEDKDEDLMLEFYKELKKNRRLLYYIGRILSNYLTCIAYKKMVYIIIICIARVHTILNCILISEPFKSIIPELLNVINHIKM